MRVAILGFSTLEQSESVQTYRYFKQRGAEITAYYWGYPKLPEGIEKVKIEAGQHIDGLEKYDLVVHGPAIHPKQIGKGAKVTTLTNIFVKNCPTKNVIGITGTKGKGTTSTLIAKLLEAQGKKVWLGGNIGQPLLDDLQEIKPSDWVVLEMSAGQLIDFNQRIHIATCLMVVPEHQDWHTHLNEYYDSKANLFKHQSKDDIAIFFADNEISKKIAAVSSGKKIPYFHQPGAYVNDNGYIIVNNASIINKADVKLLGEHNLQNICAALTTVFEATGSLDKAHIVLSSFSGLEHRLELVRSLDDVKYYDDSFGTAPETAIVAIKAIVEPKIMILGGSDKGADYAELADEIINNNVKHVITIGVTGPKIAKLLKSRNFTKITPLKSGMEEIVEKARSLAERGDAVVLSTASASFDMFKDYKDRGQQFKQAVLKLS